MSVRLSLSVGFALLAVPGAVFLGDRAGPAGIPAAVAGCAVLAVIVGWKAGRPQIHILAIAAGGTSLATTAYVLASGTTIQASGKVLSPENLGAVELIGLYALLAAVARWTTSLRVAVASGAVVWIACIVWILRITDESHPLIVLSNVAASAVFPTAAIVVGGLPRYLAHRRRELILAVRREQRLELAQDLHDFVAHDLTGIVAQAQAARFARADDLDHLRGALERIENVGVEALDTMDGLVQVLHDGDAAPRSMRRISDLPALVERFRAERGRGDLVRIELDDDLQALVPRPVQATAYRVVVEGLTNIRRHAATGSPVTVSLGRTSDGDLSVAVVNDLEPAPAGRHRGAHGGTGLTTLRERVAAVGGRLEAGPDAAGRWRLRATFPTQAKEAPSGDNTEDAGGRRR